MSGIIHSPAPKAKFPTLGKKSSKAWKNKVFSGTRFSMLETNLPHGWQSQPTDEESLEMGR